MFKFLRRNKKRQEPQQLNESEQIPCTNEETGKFSFIEISPRDSRQSLRGSKKRFSERASYNLSVMSNRLSTDKLVCEQFKVGSISPKSIIILYLRNIANKGIVSEVRDRIAAIKAPNVLDSSFVERNIEDSNLSPFPQIEATQKPDVVESALMQGRVAVIVDGSPDVLLAPTTFFDLMDTPDDAYTRWFFAASFFRIARYIMFLLAASLPGFYIALTSFNPEMIPTQLMIKIIASREETPFPIYFEMFLMMGIIEAVRIMMIRMPSQIGSTIALLSGLSLIGVGVSSNVIGPVAVIIPTLTMIASFGIPNYDLRTAVRIIQFFTMIMSSMLGILGY
ncbi:MAG TPA: spore germination protein, partial [Desulfobacteria bacterium]|nr:spore germination protein [Desulfobacteria bacterium]